MNKEELAKVLENHRHWLNEDCDGYENMKANLRSASLSSADLSGANLSSADLSDANLRYADLRDANLRYADLRGADLRDADLRGADLRYANLRYANLGSANLRYANLGYANLRDVHLRNADLRDADLRNADLSDADLSNADLRDAKMPFIPYVCPDFGSFIGYKKAYGDFIVELEILADAKRFSATSRKCRCDKAKVLRILDTNGNELGMHTVSSKYDGNFKYKVGEIVSVDDFDENRWNECSTGIHFFVNFQEAVNYN